MGTANVTFACSNDSVSTDGLFRVLINNVPRGEIRVEFKDSSGTGGTRGTNQKDSRPIRTFPFEVSGEGIIDVQFRPSSSGVQTSIWRVVADIEEITNELSA